MLSNSEVSQLGLRHFLLKIQTIICLTDGKIGRVISHHRVSPHREALAGSSTRWRRWLSIGF